MSSPSKVMAVRPAFIAGRIFIRFCLTTGRSRIHYADRSFEAEGTVLFFGNPHIPYSWETLSRTYVGYTVLFSEDFLKLSERSESLQQSPFFKFGGTPILNITDEHREFLNSLFRKMIEEQGIDYTYKDDLIRNYIHLIIHEALKMQPANNYDQHKNAATRITAVFLELLERQFPIESPDRPLQLKTAQDYAKGLSLHTNHLNHAVKAVTGKSTTAHISERIITEAKALLQHTDCKRWSGRNSQVSFLLSRFFGDVFKPSRVLPNRFCAPKNR